MNTRKDQIRESFGINAESYAISKVHAKGASLERMRTLAGPEADWYVLDIATGAGHTAFAFAPHVAKVLASDITPEMLEQVEKGAAARGLGNVQTAFADAEDLPYPDRSFDLVTCRIAPHHFQDVPAFIREAFRVLKDGGRFAVVDNIVPEGQAGDYVNAFEKLRDYSHGCCLSVSAWQAALEEAGFEVSVVETLRKQMSFSFWAQRHDAVMQDDLRAMLASAPGEARAFLSPDGSGEDLVFYLEEGLFIAEKGNA